MTSAASSFTSCVATSRTSTTTTSQTPNGTFLSLNNVSTRAGSLAMIRAMAESSRAIQGDDSAMARIGRFRHAQGHDVSAPSTEQFHHIQHSPHLVRQKNRKLLHQWP